MANNSNNAQQGNTITKGSIFAQVINRVKGWSAARKASRAAERRREITDCFKFEERDGQLFITCHGTAIRQIGESTEIRTALAYLNASRVAATKYETITL